MKTRLIGPRARMRTESASPTGKPVSTKAAAPSAPRRGLDPARAKTAAAPKSPLAALRGETLRFRVEQPPNTNLFLQSKTVTSHVVVSSEPRIRAIATFPAGNSGVALFADPKRPENEGLTFAAGQLEAAAAPAGSQRVRFGLTASNSSFVIDQTVLDSLRSVREVTEGPGRALELLPEQRARVEAARIEQTAKGTVVTLGRSNLDGGRYELQLTLPKGTAVAVVDGTLRIHGAGQGAMTLEVEAQVPYPPPHPLKLDELVDAKALAQLEQLDPHDPRAAQLTRALQGLQFLAYGAATGADGKTVPYSEKLLAGSWRFETYFGRDTMLSALMLGDVLSPKGLAIALGSVLDRVSPRGQVAHEEDVGSFAERRQLQEGHADRAKAQQPLFDYKMIDSDLLLPLLMSRFEQKAGPEALKALLDAPAPGGGTRRDAALRNVELIASQAARYDGSATTLLRIREDMMVGDWRDSNTGLAGGVFPGSVNVDLVANALAAVKALGLKNVDPAVAARWAKSPEHFQVTLSPAELRTRLTDFLALESNAGQRERLLGVDLGAGVTLRDFLGGAKAPSLAQGFSFMALSLDDQGAPIPVVSSDASLRMFLGEPSADAIRDLLPMLELPFPVGLMTPAGLLTANPAYTGARTVTAPGPDGKPKTAPLTEWLDRAGYHGSVVWVWQQSMMELGLMKQLERLSGQPENADLVRRMRHVVETLHTAATNAGELSGAELYTFDDAGKPASFGQAMGSDTEANAVQLWSTVGPAVQLAWQRMKQGAALGYGQ